MKNAYDFNKKKQKCRNNNRRKWIIKLKEISRILECVTIEKKIIT